MNEPAARELFAKLLDVARLGAQFPDARRWRALVDLLGRDGPRGKPLKVALAPETGLVTPRALKHLHRLQFVAREFFKTHRHRPSKDARAFSMALAALELPPVSETSAKLISTAGQPRFVVHHERLDGCAVRFSLVVTQKKRSGPIALGRDQLARPSDELERAVVKACGGSARAALLGLDGLDGLQVLEVTRGQLGPFVTSAWPVPDDAPGDVRALRSVCTAAGQGVVSVSLERLAADVAADSVRDPWASAEPPLATHRLARERRLFCTPDLVAPLRAVAGKQVLIRAH